MCITPRVPVTQLVGIMINTWRTGMSNFASKLGQIDPKWDKSVIFKDQFQKDQKLILKSPRFVPSEQICGQSRHP